MKQILKDGLKDSPLLPKDSRSFRISAQGVRAKETPKIPKNHEEMNLEKVNSCFVTKENHGKTQVACLTSICLFHNDLIFRQVGLKDLVLGSRSSPDMKNKDVIASHSFFLHRSTVRTFSSAPLNCLVDMMQSNTGYICYFSPPIFKSLL